MNVLNVHPTKRVMSKLSFAAYEYNTTPSALAIAIIRLALENDLVDAIIDGAPITGGSSHTNRDAWTPERVGVLCDLAEEGKSPAFVAAILGITRNAVIGKASRIGAKWKTT